MTVIEIFCLLCLLFIVFLILPCLKIYLELLNVPSCFSKKFFIIICITSHLFLLALSIIGIYLIIS